MQSGNFHTKQMFVLNPEAPNAYTKNSVGMKEIRKEVGGGKEEQRTYVFCQDSLYI